MELEELKEQIANIDTRLKRIEEWVFGKTPSSTSIPSTSKPTEAVAIQGEVRSGNWLGIIALFCFVLAAGFIIKLSIDSGWLTPVRQIAIAAILGVSLIAAGFKLMKTDYGYAALLPGGGIIILYLTIFAAHSLYNLVDFIHALFLTSIVSFYCVWLYFCLKHHVYALTAAFGAYLAPVVLSFNTNTSFTLYYFVLCSLTFATLSIWVRSRTMTLVGSSLAILLTSSIGLNLHQNTLIADLLLFHFVIFSIGTYLYSIRTQLPLTTDESWCFFPVLLLFYTAEYYYIYQINPTAAPWVALGFAGFIICLYMWAKKALNRPSLASEPMIASFCAIVIFHALYLELLPVDFKPWLLILILLGLAMLPAKAITRPRSILANFIILAVIAIISWFEYCAIIEHLFDAFETNWVLIAIATTTSLWLLFAKQHDHFDQSEGQGYLILGAAHLMAIMALYRITTDISSLLVSASWLFYAACIIVIAFSRKDKIMANSALFVLNIAAAKALLYDAASAPTIVRILCLLLTGSVLYTAGFFFRQIAKWGKPSPRN